MQTPNSSVSYVDLLDFQISWEEVFKSIFWYFFVSNNAVVLKDVIFSSPGRKVQQWEERKEKKRATFLQKVAGHKHDSVFDFIIHDLTISN